MRKKCNSKNNMRQKLGRIFFFSKSLSSLRTHQLFCSSNWLTKYLISFSLSFSFWLLLSDPVWCGWQHWCVWLWLWLWLGLLTSFWWSWCLTRLTTRWERFRDLLTFTPILKNFPCNCHLLKRKVDARKMKEWEGKKRIWIIYCFESSW